MAKCIFSFVPCNILLIHSLRFFKLLKKSKTNLVATKKVIIENCFLFDAQNCCSPFVCEKGNFNFCQI